MHHIRKLELFGFKSFCDRTQIVFNEGTTAIVGPNGCGKSNVADAIAWVVGEQSAKSLRADRMEGVIFNGTQTRKATGLAEVVLTLSLGTDYPVPEALTLNTEEFTVGRRLYRSGDSEYSIDGRSCRLKDIMALFEGSGLGPNSYALIEQGRIGQILSSKPADRRSLIEEAARITLFKSRRISAEMKLELAQQNLVRANDIIREVSRQLNSLRRQAAKARRYKRLREVLRGLHELRFALERRDLQSKMENCFARFVAAQKREKDLLGALAGEEQARLECQEECRREESLVGRAREQLADLRVKAEAVQSELQYGVSRRRDLRAREQDLARELVSIQERADLARREHQRVLSLHETLLEEIAGEQSLLDREQARSDAVQAAIAETEESIEELRSFLLNRAGQLSELHSVLARCQENLQRISAHSGRLEEERGARVRERAKLVSRLDQMQERAEATAARLSELGRQREEAQERAGELEARIERVAAELAALLEEQSIKQHRFASLEEIERRRSNYSEGVQKYLSAQQPGEEAVAAQTLADQIETDPLFEVAVEDYLNDPLQYILVDRLEDAVRGVDRLKRIGAGRCTFMTLGNGHVKDERPSRPAVSGDGVIGYLDQVLRMREDVREAFERALPQYASTVLVSDLSAAFRVAETTPGGQYLTLAGEAYSPRGTLAAAGERKSMAGFLSLKREKRDLERQLGTLRRKIQLTREELAQAKQEQARMSESLRKLSDESRDLDINTALFRHQIESLTGELRKSEQTEIVLNLELSQLSHERQAFEARMLDAERGVGEIEERSKSGSEEIVQLGQRLESLKADSGRLSKSLAALNSAHAVRRERLSATEAELRRLEGEMAEALTRVEANQAETLTVRNTVADLELGIQEAERQSAECAGQTVSAEAELGDRSLRLASLRERLAALEGRLQALQAEREEAMESRGRVEIEKTRLENDLEHLERSCLEEFQAPLAQIAAGVGEAGLERSLAEVSQACQELRDKVEKFGAINMRALEEYQELDERHTFLTHQRADIEQSIADTQKAIAEMNRRSVEQFRDAFGAIRAHFIDVFQILFKGGQCDLRLLDEEDVLESGIDIIAQPPGKRLQNVLLLSGGEKALTALALLIAIFRYRPSPFCVLDEVDAPLDDANIKRFTALITELSGQTQFIIITHNKKTMEIAGTLYGVTMEDPGISRVVSVDFRPRLRAVAG
jgi:chromosome segregation protein